MCSPVALLGVIGGNLSSKEIYTSSASLPSLLFINKLMAQKLSGFPNLVGKHIYDNMPFRQTRGLFSDGRFIALPGKSLQELFWLAGFRLTVAPLAPGSSSNSPLRILTFNLAPFVSPLLSSFSTLICLSWDTES